jgi:hypothetical protein
LGTGARCLPSLPQTDDAGRIDRSGGLTRGRAPSRLSPEKQRSNRCAPPKS